MPDSDFRALTLSKYRLDTSVERMSDDNHDVGMEYNEPART